MQQAAVRFKKPALVAIDTTSVNENAVYTIGAEPMTEEEWGAPALRSGDRALNDKPALLKAPFPFSTSPSASHSLEKFGNNQD